MSSLVGLLKEQKYWDLTLERMLRKENLTTEQRMDAMIINDTNIRNSIINKIENKEYNWSTARKIAINKMGTKRKRIVYMYSMEDRFLLGVLYRVFSDFYSKELSKNCFSYKRGVKTVDAIHYIKNEIENNISLENSYGVKLDIHAYFNSVNIESLRKVINEISNNEECIKSLLESLYFNDEAIYKNEVINEYKSLIPGTAFSSFLANYILKDIDNEIVGSGDCVYARYSDDIIMISSSKEKLVKNLDLISHRLKELGLTINEDKYRWFEPGEEIDFLGLRISSKGDIDISEVSFKKAKTKIKHQCDYGKRLIHRLGKDPDKVAKDIIGRYNYRVYKCFIQDASKFGWAYYAFRYINTIETIRQLDFYFKDRLRQMITNKNNSANIKKVSDERLKKLGYVSIVEMFIKFKTDFDYYCDAVDLIEG